MLQDAVVVSREDLGQISHSLMPIIEAFVLRKRTCVAIYFFGIPRELNNSTHLHNNSIKILVEPPLSLDQASSHFGREILNALGVIKASGEQHDCNLSIKSEKVC